MVWVFDGTIDQFAYYAFDDFRTVIPSHDRGCTTCHGGNDTVDTRADAHVNDWQPIPGSSSCSCHTTIVADSANSLHTNLGGYVTILADRGADVAVAGTLQDRFNEQCTRCHVANDDTESACGFCHVSVPAVAGGGFLHGHNFRKTPDMERNCTACHGSRIKDEFFGLNQGLIDSNSTAYTSAQLGTTGLIQPDVHFAAAQSVNADGYEVGCTLCHSGNEMHGVGAPVDGDRYAVTSGPDCTEVGCHDTLPGNTLHNYSAHLSKLACQACHAQPYKNCFGCHTDIDTADTGLPYYTINEGAQSATNDALMTFRIGANLNPSIAYSYVVLRHVPVDADTFKYAVSDSQDGLIPNMTALPTWKFASPHNIVRVTPIQSACNNCHSTGNADFWLTDALADDEGWLEPQYETVEETANAPAVVGTPVPMAP